jgi:hypothetical protein
MQEGRLNGLWRRYPPALKKLEPLELNLGERAITRRETARRPMDSKRIRGFIRDYSQIKRSGDCEVFADHAYAGFHTSPHRDTEDSDMKVPAGRCVPRC